ncbi:MAG: bifunctional riboflavin kinase/FAD synthetase [Gammaproteobacteria bacterium]|nr:bifunctional riboflavin kinase/FAD synthetase [Gammaproteobacteria bacterium]
MELIRGIHNLRPQHHGCVATIGNFDGIHLGHQAMLRQLEKKAKTLHLPLTVITFEPQPQEYFHGDTPPRLTRFREKIDALTNEQVNRVLCLNFNEALAGMPAEDFIKDILVDGLGVRYLLVGDDFRFGKARKGDYQMLQAAGEQFGFEVTSIDTVDMASERVSSTRIRENLLQGKMAEAEQLLGRPYKMCGRIAHGDKRGRSIGFPTANIHLHRKATPVEGVFTVEMTGINNTPLKGVANVGTRPTVCGTRALLEVHLFDFDQDIYGRYVGVNFLHKIRDEQHFDSIDVLVQQIKQDAADAREFFRERH